MTVFANVPEVDGLSSTLEQEQSVEIFEKDGVGLMDRAQDCLTGCSQLSKETDDVESALTVQTGGGL